MDAPNFNVSKTSAFAPISSTEKKEGWLSNVGNKLGSIFENLVIPHHLNSIHPGKAQIPVTTSTFADEVKSINSLFSGSKNSSDPKAILTKFCNDIIAFSRSGPQGTVENDHYYLSAIIFLADRDLAGTAALINPQDKAGSLERINDYFKRKFDDILKDLQDYQTRVSKANVQDAALALSINKPETIAQILITSAGTLNIGLVQYIQNRLIYSNPNSPLSYEKDIAFVLKELVNSPQLKSSLTIIVKPDDPKSNANDIIRCSLDLDPTTVITDTHAIQAALAALLSHLRQGPVGSCFATYLGIELMHQRIDKCLQDFAEILKTGRAVRLVNGKPKTFFYKLSIADGARSAPISIGRDGKGQGTEINFWDIPGIHFALVQLGVKDFAKLSNDVLVKLFQKEDENTVKINPDTLISLCVQQSFADSSINDSDKAQLIEKAIFAFTAETNNPLLRIWEILLADMAEGRPQDFVRGRIINCVSSSFSSIYKSAQVAKSPSAIAEVKSTLEATLDQRIQLVFDASIKLSHVASDGSSTSGGYTLNGVDNPHSFSKFVDDTVIQTQKILSARNKNTGAILNTQAETLNKIRDYINRDNTFLKQAIWNYDDSNKQVQDPVNHWEDLEHLPFRDETGDDNKESFAIEVGSPLPNPITVYPKNSNDLLVDFLKFVKGVSLKYDLFKGPISNALAPGDTPDHAFGLTIEDKHVLEWLKSGKDAQAWVYETITAPGIAVGESQIDEDTKSRLNQFVSLYILPSDSKDNYQNKINDLNGNYSVTEYAGKVLDIIASLVQVNDLQKGEVGRLVSGFLLDVGLPEDIRRSFNARSVQIADTNWNVSVKDIGFRVSFDLLAQVPALVIENDDGSGIEVADPAEWVKEWDFFPVRLQTVA